MTITFESLSEAQRTLVRAITEKLLKTQNTVSINVLATGSIEALVEKTIADQLVPTSGQHGTAAGSMAPAVRVAAFFHINGLGQIAGLGSGLGEAAIRRASHARPSAMRLVVHVPALERLAEIAGIELEPAE